MAVTDNTTLYQDHSTAPSYNSIGSGQGATLDADQTLLPPGASGRRGDNVTQFGFWYSQAAANMSAANTYTVSWFWSVTPSLVSAVEMRVGSGTGAYRAHTGLEALFADTGRWTPMWFGVDSGGVVTGSPNTSSITHKALVVDMGNINANLRNLHIGRDHYAVKPCMTLDGASALNDLAATDLANRSGVLLKDDGQFKCFANFQVGDSANASTGDFSGAQIVFPAAPQIAAGQDWLNITINLENPSSNPDWSNGSIASGDPTAAAQAKPSFAVVGNAGSLPLAGRLFNGYNFVTLTDAVDAQRCVFQNGSDAVTADGADLRNASLSDYRGATDTSALVWDTAADPNGKLDNITATKGAAATHAATFGVNSPTDFTLTNWTTDGYNAANGQNDSTFLIERTSGTVNITVIGGTGNFSYKSLGATVNIIIPQNTLTINGLVVGGSFAIFDNEDSDDQFLGSELASQDPITSTSFAFSHSDPGNEVVIQMVAPGFIEINQDETLASGDQSITLTPRPETNI